MTKKALSVAAAIAITAAACIPFPTRVAQALKVQFAARDSQPIAGIRVYQNWGFDGLEDHGGYEAFTDSSGMVVLPARVAHGSAMWRLLRRAVTLFFVHSSYGPHASFSVGLPPGLEVNFQSPAFSPRLVSGAVDGYRDSDGREYHPGMLDGRQVFLVWGDFAAGSDTIRFVLERKTLNPIPEATPGGVAHR